MNGTISLSKRGGSAAIAGWWTVLIVATWMTVAWFVWLAILNAKPDWLLRLWGGGDLDFSTIRTIVLCFFTAFKLLLFLLVIMTIWLTFWANRLKRIE